MPRFFSKNQAAFDFIILYHYYNALMSTHTSDQQNAPPAAKKQLQRLCGGDPLFQASLIIPLMGVVAGMIALAIGASLPIGEHGWNPPDAGSVCITKLVEHTRNTSGHFIGLIADLYPSLLDAEGRTGGVEMRWSQLCLLFPPFPSSRASRASRASAGPEGDGCPTAGRPDDLYDCDMNDDWPRVASKRRVEPQRWAKPGHGDPFLGLGGLLVIGCGAALAFVSLVWCMAASGVQF